MDFGVEREFSMMTMAAQLLQIEKDESSFQNPRIVSINRSGLHNANHQS